MRDRAIRIKCLKKAIDNTKKIGVRSISDIISNSSMSFSQKINYIRHHYTYYEGNYDLFATSTGKPNARKFKLNNLIVEILKGKKDASELKEFNKKIMDWRKETSLLKNEQNEHLLENFDGSSIRELMQWEKDISNAHSTAQEYISLIEKYLANNPAERESCKTKSYKEMKNIAILWNIEQEYKIDDNINTEDMTPGEYFRYCYLNRLHGTNPSSHLDLICEYLNSNENKKYKKELLETAKIDALKEESVQWAILKYIDKDEKVMDIVEKCPSKLKTRIKARAGVFEEKDENKRIYKLMKEYAEDLERKKEVVNG